MRNHLWGVRARDGRVVCRLRAELVCVGRVASE